MSGKQETAESKKVKRNDRTRFVEKFLFEGGTGKLMGLGVMTGSIALGGLVSLSLVGIPIGTAITVYGVLAGGSMVRKAKRKKKAREKAIRESERKSDLKKNLDKLLFEGKSGALVAVGIGAAGAVALASVGVLPVLAVGAGLVIGTRQVVKAGQRGRDRKKYEQKFARGTL